jgi:ribosomal protein S18 acetylase RimI-like enzyme
MSEKAAGAALIRPARPADAPRLAALIREHAAYEGASTDGLADEAALVGGLSAEAPRLLVLVAEDTKGRIVGYISLVAEFATWTMSEYLHMDCLYLEAEARGSGLGRRLVAAAAGEARRRGWRQMQWQTPADNLDAIGFYRHIGAEGRPKMRFFLDPERFDP